MTKTGDTQEFCLLEEAVQAAARSPGVKAAGTARPGVQGQNSNNKILKA